MLPTGPSVTDGVSVPLQLSEAVAPPNALFIVAVDGLHPSEVEAVEVVVITVEELSKVQVTVCDAVAVFPHSSVALQVLV